MKTKSKTIQLYLTVMPVITERSKDVDHDLISNEWLLTAYENHLLQPFVDITLCTSS